MHFDSAGVRLYYELNGPRDGRPVVLVHGFASDYQLNWVGSRWQETLVNAGRRVIGLDCRGHGESDKPHNPNAYGPSVMASDVVRLLDHLAIGAADYIGYSMGGRIGIQMLLDSPSRLRRAVLGGIGWTGAFRNADSVARALRTRQADDPIAQRFLDFAASRETNDLEALAACILGPNPGPEPARLAEVAVPVLVVVGDQDDIADGVPMLMAAMPSARLVMLPGRNHMSAVPAREFKEAALAFLES
jgi:pimeloyl-ACP methyl ester carboxylesterase